MKRFSTIQPAPFLRPEPESAEPPPGASDANRQERKKGRGTFPVWTFAIKYTMIHQLNRMLVETVLLFVEDPEGGNVSGNREKSIKVKSAGLRVTTLKCVYNDS